MERQAVVLRTQHAHHPRAHATPAAQLTASNTHGDHGAVAQSDVVVLGLPAAPSLPAGTDGINPGVGKVALTWTAPKTNAFIGTK